jgi:cell division transport system permease protein
MISDPNSIALRQLRMAKNKAQPKAQPKTSKAQVRANAPLASGMETNDRTLALAPASPWRAWLRSHGYSLFSSLGRLLRAPFAQLMTFGVLALALALPCMGHLALKNARTLSQAAAQPGDVSLFLQQDLNAVQADALRLRLQQTEGVQQITIKTPEQALAEFRQLTSFSDALSALDDNPLPFVLVVELQRDVLKTGRALPLVEQLRSQPEVDIAQFDQEWLLRLKALLALAERAIWVFGALLSLTVLLVVGNTIRLELAARVDEIQIMKLVGADAAFVRRPFLYSGFWFGLFSAILAVLLVAATVHFLRPAVAELALSYGSDYRLQSLSWAEALLLLGFGTALGWIGALIAALSHMAAPENAQ